MSLKRYELKKCEKLKLLDLWHRKKKPKEDNLKSKLVYEKLLKVVHKDAKMVSSVQWQAYFQSEFCYNKIENLLETADFQGKVYLIRALPEKKFRNIILFCTKESLLKFFSFLQDLVMSQFYLLEKENDELFTKIQNVLQAEKVKNKIAVELQEYDWEEIARCFLQDATQSSSKLIEQDFPRSWQDVFYEEKLEDILVFYENCSKEEQIEILEQIFRRQQETPTVFDRTLQYEAKEVLEIRSKTGKINMTEQLYLDYAYKMS